jgi:hypothetical protein
MTGKDTQAPAPQPEQKEPEYPKYRVDKRVRQGKYTVLRDGEPFAETFVHVDAVRITMAMEMAHKQVRSRPLTSAPRTQDITEICTGESYDPEDEQCKNCPARNNCPVEKEPCRNTCGLSDGECNYRDAELEKGHRQDATEKVLDDITQFVQKHSRIVDVQVISSQPLIKFIQSLRQYKEQPSEQREEGKQ